MHNEKKNKFTIITVCYNAKENLQKTITSILEQTYTEFEYIIKDGNSSDDTLQMIHKLEKDDFRVKKIVGQDKGIYDAMNIAVNEATGDFVLFMNAGDIFADEHVLQRVNRKINMEEADIYYGDIIEVGNDITHLRTYSKRNSRLWYYGLGACLCHQSMFCKKDLFAKKKFDTSYLVCADKEWQLYFLKRKYSALSLQMVIAKVLIDGYSTNHIIEYENETKRCIKTYVPLMVIPFALLEKLKRYSYFHILISKIEKHISCKDVVDGGRK